MNKRDFIKQIFLILLYSACKSNIKSPNSENQTNEFKYNRFLGKRNAYLQFPTPTSITIKWRTSSPTSSLVQFGTDWGSLENFFDSNVDFDHELIIKNLTPETKYYYTWGSIEKPGNLDEQQFFWTSPAVGGTDPVNIWIIGDSGTKNEEQQKVIQVYNSRSQTVPINFGIALGDNAYDHGDDSQYQNSYFDSYSQIIKNLPIWLCLGNHEAQTNNPITQTGPYFDMFSFPREGELGGIPSKTKSYYSFEYSNIHFICLDTSLGYKNLSEDSPMMDWLEQDLKSSNQTWNIAFFHHPPYSKGSHDSDYNLDLIKVREIILPILEKYGVDLVLCGHSHNYERSILLHGHYGYSDELVPSMILDSGSGKSPNEYKKNSKSGTVYVVNGVGAEPRLATSQHPVIYNPAKLLLGAMYLNIEGNRLLSQFINENNEVIDEFTILKN